MKKLLFCCLFFWLNACNTSKVLPLKTLPTGDEKKGGTHIFRSVISAGWKERDSTLVNEILSGNLPRFLRKFVALKSRFTDSSGIGHQVILYVSPDYLSVGKNEDFVRVPLSPMAAQKIADSLQCFLPTKKVVDLIYEQSVVKIEPVPMLSFRDSGITMWQHHLIIEGQRQEKKGLITGIKKDLIISDKILSDKRPDRVAIYGWQKTDGKVIQPVYTGHVNWYVDYSHGIRLIYRLVKVDGKWMDYSVVLHHPVLRKLLTDEDSSEFIRYKYQVIKKAAMKQLF